MTNEERIITERPEPILRSIEGIGPAIDKLIDEIPITTNKDTKEVIIQSGKPITKEDVDAVLAKNVVLLQQSYLADYEPDLDKISELMQKFHPIDKSSEFKREMEEFKKLFIEKVNKHSTDRKAEKEKQDKESAETLDEIKKGQTENFAIWNIMAQNHPEVVGQLPKEEKKSGTFLRRLYYYVWWIFSDEKSFEKISNEHKYPRNRGKLKPYYKEIANKDLAESLSGAKSIGNVEGIFTGALGLVPRNVVFEDTVPPMNLEAGQILALGVARAKRWDLRTSEFRGMTANQLLRFDPERLIWKWIKWKGSSTKKEEDDKKVTEDDLSVIAKKLKTLIKENKDDKSLEWHTKKGKEALDEIYLKIKDLERIHKALPAPSTDEKKKQHESVNKWFMYIDDVMAKVQTVWDEDARLSSENKKEILNRLGAERVATWADLIKEIEYFENVIKAEHK